MGPCAFVLALSAAHACDGPRIEADDSLVARYPSAIVALQTHFAGEGVDRCARVRLVAAGSEIVVVVTLADGRATVRRVAGIEDVEATLDALLMVPETAESAPKPAAPEPEREAPRAKPEEKLARDGFEIGVGASGRLVGAPLFFGLGVSAHAQMRRDDWLLAVMGHVDPSLIPIGSTSVDGFRGSGAGVGVGAGRRWHEGSADIDFLVGFGINLQRQEATLDGEKFHARLVDPRVLVSARLSESGDARVRAYLGADFEGWMPERSDDAPKGLVPWPYWSLGLTFGVKWETR